MSANSQLACAAHSGTGTSHSQPPHSFPSSVNIPADHDYIDMLFTGVDDAPIDAELRWAFDETALKYATFDADLLKYFRSLVYHRKMSRNRKKFIIMVFSLVLPTMRARLASGCDQRRLETILYLWRDEFKVCAMRMHNAAEPATDTKPPKYVDWLDFTRTMSMYYDWHFDYHGKWTRHDAATGGANRRGTHWVGTLPLTETRGYAHEEPESVTSSKHSSVVNMHVDAAVTGYLTLAVALHMLILHDELNERSRLNASILKVDFVDPEFPDPSAVCRMFYTRLVPRTSKQRATFLAST